MVLVVGIGFVNLFGVVGGFIVSILCVKVEMLFVSDVVGLLMLVVVVVIGSLIIFILCVNRIVV